MSRPTRGVDDDPLNDRCDACGADVAEPCRPGCIGLAAAQDAADEAYVLGRTTGGSPLIVVEVPEEK